MSKVNVYNLEKFLPLYIIKKDQNSLLRGGNEEIIGTYTSSLADELENTSRENIYLNNVNQENDTSPKWVNKQIALGILGEEIAMAYLKKNKKHVERVSLTNSSLGYDIRETIENREIYYEVKSTKRTDGKFFISYNELSVANIKRENYNIFYLIINETSKSIIGYLINNPVIILGINFKKLTEIKEYQNASIVSSNFLVQLKEDYFDDLYPIRMEKYVNLI